jgi:hypothetical protein
MRKSRALALMLTLAAGVALAQPAQKVTGPVATYWISAQTQSGMVMPGGGAPDRGVMMRMMMGGGGGAQRQLTLQLGSTRQVGIDPRAEHLPPPRLGVGSSLPLLTPRMEAQPAVEDRGPEPPRDFQRPKGRMLFFWGCGEHAGPGQPVVIDFSQIKPGQIPPGMAAMMKGLTVARGQPPSPSRSATYGEWPNAQARTAVPSDATLAGEHTVRGNYIPDIHFILRQDQDFLAPLELTTNARGPAGAVQLAWRAVPFATGYIAGVIGGGQDTVVAWTSADAQTSPFALPDYVPPAEAARLVREHGLLSPQITSCTVPKEVVDAAPHAMLQMVAYGPEADFSDPPRPTNPKTPWNRQWTVKVRYRSATGGMLGMAMPGGRMGEGGPGGEQRGERHRGMMHGMGLPVPGF